MTMHQTSYRAAPGTYLGTDRMRAVAPSIFATTAHESRSERFTPVPTINLISHLEVHGFYPVMVGQCITRDVSRREYTRHVVRLQTAEAAARVHNVGDLTPEIVIMNANDGTTAYRMDAGLFRLICLNGMVVGDNVVNAIRFRHTGNILDEITQGAYDIVGEFQRVNEHVDRFKRIVLDPMQQLRFAEQALALRDSSVAVSPIEALQLHRYGDKGDDLWKVFNVVQENLIRGGMRGRTTGGRRTSTRRVQGVAQDVGLNKRLWTLAERTADAFETTVVR